MSKETTLSIINKDLLTKSKIEIEASAKDYIKNLLDDGFIAPNDIIADATRLSVFFNEFLKEAKKNFDPERAETKGVKISERNGGKTLLYNEDWKVAELEKELKERKELVKTATNSKEQIYDSEGIEVTKVGFKYRRNSITVTF